MFLGLIFLDWIFLSSSTHIFSIEFRPGLWGGQGIKFIEFFSIHYFTLCPLWIGVLSSHLKAKSTKPLSDKELLSQALSFRLENKTRELEKELSITKEELKIEREEVAKFQEKSEEWSKKQKQELLDKIKSLEERIKQLEEENRKLKDQQNGQLTAQIEVKETKRWSWLKIKK